MTFSMGPEPVEAVHPSDAPRDEEINYQLQSDILLT